MRRTLAPLVLVFCLPITVAACLWDRDTPADEAKGAPEAVVAITGRFARNPPLYYEMRLKRVADLLERRPDDLAAYDDAGVACDRLGRGDEAVEWMRMKKPALDKLDPSVPGVKDHLYRYHANLGTFLVHKWAREGADRSRLDEVKAARDEIARALEINPHAHFGRETYQLKAIQWIIEPPPTVELRPLPNLLGWPATPYEGEVKPGEARDAVLGLSGLVVLGNAWESVDVFHALSVALRFDSVGQEPAPTGGRNTLAHLAWLRCRELIDQGKGSMLPDAPGGESLKKMIPEPGFVDGAAELLNEPYRELRAEADAWEVARTAFMTARLQKGRHPDTDPRFWDGYVEEPAPELPTKSVPDVYHDRMALRMRLAMAAALSVLALAVALTVVLGVRSRRRRARLKAGPDEWGEFR